MELLQRFNRYNLFRITKARFQSVWQLAARVAKGGKCSRKTLQYESDSQVLCISASSRVNVNAMKFMGKIHASYEK